MDEQTQLRTVLVTGAHGFIGRNLIAHLRARTSSAYPDF
jgi:nucleoside-diphosphate-sugar epimerase